MSKRSELEQWLEEEHERQTWSFPGASSYTVYTPLEKGSEESGEPDPIDKAAKSGWLTSLMASVASLF